ncbi:MAG: hypothetical protein KIT74_11250 [Fimbriimonadales bacterium]|nr:hypothetical protein [Fimbriimonadales bacterium]
MLAFCPTFGQLPLVTERPELTTDYREIPRPSDPEQTITILRYPSPIVTDKTENNTVDVEVHLPRTARTPMPMVILLHYWGATDLGVERRFARNLNDRGFAAAILTLPYHLQRTPAGIKSGDYAIRPDVEFLRETMTQSVFDIKRLVDWIEARPQQFDINRIAVAGISLGAVIGALVLGVEPRVTAGAFLLGGVDLAGLLWNSSITISTRNGLRSQGYNEERLREALESVEPSRYPRQSLGENVIVIGARFDDIVPRENTEQLIDMFDAKQVVWLNTGHYGGALAEQRLYRTVADFFESRFLGAEFAQSRTVGLPTLRIGVHYNTDYKLTVAAGLDIWRAPKGQGFVSAMITPEGPMAFAGANLTKGLTAGVVVTPRQITWGVFWGVVL